MFEGQVLEGQVLEGHIFKKDEYEKCVEEVSGKLSGWHK